MDGPSAAVTSPFDGEEEGAKPKPTDAPFSLDQPRDPAKKE